MRLPNAKEGGKTSIIETKPPLWEDVVKVSRPGWWLVSIWLYLAPTGKLHVTDEAQQADLYSQSSIVFFWLGLVYVCLPLNILTYGLNDFADADIDLDNQRKGNWLFGPKGMARERLRKILNIGIATSFIPLLLFVFQTNLSKMFLPQTASTILTETNIEASTNMWKMRLPIILIWYAAGVTANVSYNFKILGHLSSQGPFETPMVFLGFSLITAFSYWVNVAPSLNAVSGDATGSTSAIGDEGSRWVFGMSKPNEGNDSFYLFGCNPLYWIHLGFLIVRTQLWTEFVDFDSDSKTKRTTTLVRLGSKARARSLVLFVLGCEICWNFSIFRHRSTWLMPFAFALIGPFLFMMLEAMLSGQNSFSSIAPKTHTSMGTKFMALGVCQTVGGIVLMMDAWNKGLFVN